MILCTLIQLQQSFGLKLDSSVLPILKMVEGCRCICWVLHIVSYLLCFVLCIVLQSIFLYALFSSLIGIQAFLFFDYSFRLKEYNVLCRINLFIGLLTFFQHGFKPLHIKSFCVLFSSLYSFGSFGYFLVFQGKKNFVDAPKFGITHHKKFKILIHSKQKETCIPNITNQGLHFKRIRLLLPLPFYSQDPHMQTRIQEEKQIDAGKESYLNIQPIKYFQSLDLDNLQVLQK